MLAESSYVRHLRFSDIYVAPVYLGFQILVLGPQNKAKAFAGSGFRE